MAPNGPADRGDQCPLIGMKQSQCGLHPDAARTLGHERAMSVGVGDERSIFGPARSRNSWSKYRDELWGQRSGKGVLIRLSFSATLRHAPEQALPACLYLG